MLGFGLWWLARAEAKARGNGEGYGEEAAPAELAAPANDAAQDLIVRLRQWKLSPMDLCYVRRQRL